MFECAPILMSNSNLLSFDRCAHPSRARIGVSRSVSRVMALRPRSSSWHLASVMALRPCSWHLGLECALILIGFYPSIAVSCCLIPSAHSPPILAPRRLRVHVSFQRRLGRDPPAPVLGRCARRSPLGSSPCAHHSRARIGVSRSVSRVMAHRPRSWRIGLGHGA
jgi:hypothetical protein